MDIDPVQKMKALAAEALAHSRDISPEDRELAIRSAEHSASLAPASKKPRQKKRDSKGRQPQSKTSPRSIAKRVAKQQMIRDAYGAEQRHPKD